jgi:hypothetical protein
MHARVPLDVDMEDRLIYGLTPIRLAYIVVALLVGITLWSSHWAPTFARGVASFLVIAGGSALAWGRWRGRAADGWAIDMAKFVVATYRLSWDHGWLRRRRVGRQTVVQADAASP